MNSFFDTILLNTFINICLFFNLQNIQELWATVVAMASNLPIELPEKLVQRRSSEQFINMMIARAKTFLEQSFFSRLQDSVWNHPGGTDLG
jgi:hypothetical protein